MDAPNNVTWDILDAFFTQGGGADCSNPLVRHQIDSFNEFLDKKLQQIIQGFNPIQVCHNWKPEFEDYAYKIYINVLQPALAKPMFVGQDGSQVIMTPHLARMNNLTYAANLYVDVHIITEVINDDGVKERNETSVPAVCIGKIPIMVRSKVCVLTQVPALGEGGGNNECRYDPGGYFIINGNEKVVISQDRISENRTLVFAPNGNADGLNAEIRSMPDGVFLPPKTTSLHLSGKPNHMGRIIRLNTSFLRTEVPLFVMFRALGVESDNDIIHHVLLDIDDQRNERMKTELTACAEDACDTHTMVDAQYVLVKILGTTGTPREYMDQPAKAIEILRNTIRQDFLPHVGPSFRKKALYLGFMVRKLLRIHLGYQDYDNRDSYIHKRIDTPGVLFSNLFRQCYGKMIKEMRNLIVRELNLWRASTSSPLQIVTPNNVHRFFKQTLLDTGLRYALSTGNWGVKTLGSFQNIRQGVAQVLNRMSYLSTLSHLRRINTPMEKNGKLVQPRKLENSQFGMICPSETPEGASVGLVKNMALSTHVTINMSSAHVREVIDELDVYQYGDHMNSNEARAFLKSMGSIDSVHVFINGDIVGYTTNPVKVYSELKHKKRAGVIPPTTAVIWDVKMGCIQVNTEAGRMCRPLYIVEPENGGVGKLQLRLLNVLKHKNVSWAEFYEKKQFANFIAPLDDDGVGILEYMDVEEIDNAMVAMFSTDLCRGIKGTSLPPKFTHCEIHPSLMNGVLAANIPFSDHNQSPRNCYQCLWEETPVYMMDGTWKPIKHVQVGDRVICFNPTTMVPTVTSVVHQYVRPSEKPIYKITTITGRSIYATHDHKFMTNQGWKDVRQFRDSTLVGVYPTPPTILRDTSVPTTAILTTVGNESVDDRLTSYGILPLTNKSWQIDIIARLTGYMQCRGFNPVFASPLDAEMFESDVKLLGFQQYGATDSGFLLLMECLDASLVTNSPYWINAIDKRAKVEYVGGLLGGNRTVVGTIVNNKLSELGMTVAEAGYRYNTPLQMDVNIQSEYVAYTIFMSFRQDAPLSFEKWRELIDTKATTIFVPVASMRPSRSCIISDITVQSENHSFIADGFAVSNSAMGKQAVGIYMSNFNQRIDTMAHILNYPQKPLVSTKLSKYTYSDELPSGINSVVAIMTHTGFNQEDSVMINKSAIDRGLFTSTYFKSYKDQCSKNHSTGEEEVFCKPDPATTAHMKPYNYDKLGEDGFIPKNTAVNGSDILIGKVMPHKMHGVIHPRDTSHVMKANDEGFIDMNYTGTNAEAYKFTKIRLRKYRKPVIGDKVACYTDDHQVLTSDGWVPIAKLTLEHKVASLVDNALVYQQPSAVQAYDYNGMMYEVKSHHVNLCVTPNHRMWIRPSYPGARFGVQLAEDIYGKHMNYKKNVDEWTPDFNSTSIPWCLKLNGDATKVTHFRFEAYTDGGGKYQPETEVDIDTWLTFYGLYVAEGVVAPYSSIAFTANKPRVQTALSTATDALGWKLTKCMSRGQVVSWNVENTYAVKALGRAAKRLQHWVYWLDREQCRKLIHALCVGDGGVMKNGVRRYVTSCTGLADDFQKLCLHAGFSCNKERTECTWVLTIITSQNEPIVNKWMGKWVDFGGKVYCCTMHIGEGVIYVRRNGTPVWCGQSRSAQKGTIGMVYNHQDMPFTKDGITPDIIMNPHAIPSRMTIGQLMECIMGKAACHIGSLGDSTPFSECSVEDIAQVLETSGMERYGNEILYNGRTGEMMQTEIFIGPTYYQRLKHMVADKAHVRGGNGPVVMLTRQPAEGRARNGGLRFGEMERDAIVAHGASAFLKERMLDTSDNYRVFVCRKCGLLCTANPEKNIYKCAQCKNSADITQVRIPYSMKLLMQELMTMGVAPRIIV